MKLSKSIISNFHQIKDKELHNEKAICYVCSCGFFSLALAPNKYKIVTVTEPVDQIKEVLGQYSAFLEETKQDNQVVLVKDNFTDDVSQINGIESVTWEGQKFSRKIYDLSTEPEAILFSTPIEIIGREILYTFSSKAAMASKNLSYYFNHSNAVSYIQTWVANTSSTCQTNPTVYQDQNNWNGNYTKYSCNDCQNYVSQALNNGGLPTDGTWYKDSSAWISVPSFKDWLTSTGNGVSVNQLSLLIGGDLGFVGSDHAVMVAGVSPYTYSAHTSDRRSRAWDSSINQYWVIFTQ